MQRFWVVYHDIGSIKYTINVLHNGKLQWEIVCQLLYESFTNADFLSAPYLWNIIPEN